MAKIGDVSLILKLLAGLVLGALLGFVANEAVMDVVVSLRHIFGQIIFFLVPLVIVGFITPAIVRLGQNASKILVVAVCLAYASSLGAALFSMGSGYLVIPHLSIATETETLRKLPEMVFRLDIPPLFSVMSALVTALFFGVAIAWTKSETLGKVFAELERIMTWLVTRVLIPILPFFVGLSFMGLAYEGSLTKHLPIFVTMVALVIFGHFIWLTVLYGIAGIVSGRNPSQVFRYYTPAYLTAVGTM
ncbi:MAG: cation:dicarboxylase symporter family transporter, partial [Desulfovibrio fairfieldensis]|nr:cation:dicarboxylase symporter family transporter [Desulfovibrio fairfieldensis]